MSTSVASDYYDRLGRKLDLLNFYGKPAANELCQHARFEDALNMFELGMGTGKFARRLFDNYLTPKANYLACDISEVMVQLARDNLSSYENRAQIIKSDGNVRLPLLDDEADRIISIFVLDLLSDENIALFFTEAYRALKLDGKVCIASLHGGAGLPSRIVSWMWMQLFSRRPDLVGGCRPINLDMYIDRRHWYVAHRRVMAPFLVPFEVWILEKRQAQTLHP